MPPSAPRPSGSLSTNLLSFGRLLRALGLPVTPAQQAAMLQSTAHLDLGSRQEVRAAFRALLAGRREHVPTFDRAFDLFFRAADPLSLPAEVILNPLLDRVRRKDKRVVNVLFGVGMDDAVPDEEPLVDSRETASGAEVLRRKDFAELTPEEEAAVRKLLATSTFVPATRRTRRWARSNAGRRVDLRATLRESLRHGGEPLRLAYRGRKQKPRPLVVLCDVSGSMETYSRILLQFIYTLGARCSLGNRRGPAQRWEAFAFGTRLTRLTRQLARRDVDQALTEAAASVVDWGGGTKIGEALKRFNFDWGRRVLGQGAVVLVISDGWDRGEVELLEREIARLHRSCERLIWLNPLLGTPGYRPLTRGMEAALPHVDDFLPVHNLHSLEQLGRLLSELQPRAAASSRK